MDAQITRTAQDVLNDIKLLFEHCEKQQEQIWDNETILHYLNESIKNAVPVYNPSDSKKKKDIVSYNLKLSPENMFRLTYLLKKEY